jgi:hypothetical protein
MTTIIAYADATDLNTKWGRWGSGGVGEWGSGGMGDVGEWGM